MRVTGTPDLQQVGQKQRWQIITCHWHLKRGQSSGALNLWDLTRSLSEWNWITGCSVGIPSRNGGRSPHLVTGTRPADVSREKPAFSFIIPWRHSLPPWPKASCASGNTPYKQLPHTTEEPGDHTTEQVGMQLPTPLRRSPHLSASCPSERLCTSPLWDGVGTPGFQSGLCLMGGMFWTSPTDSKGACILEIRLIFWNLMLRSVCKMFPRWVLLRSPLIPRPDMSLDSLLVLLILGFIFRECRAMSEETRTWENSVINQAAFTVRHKWFQK